MRKVEHKELEIRHDNLELRLQFWTWSVRGDSANLCEANCRNLLRQLLDNMLPTLARGPHATDHSTCSTANADNAPHSLRVFDCCSRSGSGLLRVVRLPDDAATRAEETVQGDVLKLSVQPALLERRDVSSGHAF